VLLTTLAVGSKKQKSAAQIARCVTRIETFTDTCRKSRLALQKHKSEELVLQRKPVVPSYKHKTFHAVSPKSPLFMSAKTSGAMDLIKGWMALEPRPQITVFCVFLQQLELLRTLCESIRGVKVSMYTGEMPQHKKDEALAQWQTEDDRPVLLMSMKGGRKFHQHMCQSVLR